MGRCLLAIDLRTREVVKKLTPSAMTGDGTRVLNWHFDQDDASGTFLCAPVPCTIPSTPLSSSAIRSLFSVCLTYLYRWDNLEEYRNIPWSGRDVTYNSYVMCAPSGGPGIRIASVQLPHRETRVKIAEDRDITRLYGTSSLPDPAPVPKSF
jgi:hypothetical protein